MGAVGFVVELISDSGIGRQSKKSNEAELSVAWSTAAARGPQLRVFGDGQGDAPGPEGISRPRRAHGPDAKRSDLGPVSGRCFRCRGRGQGKEEGQSLQHAHT